MLREANSCADHLANKFVDVPEGLMVLDNLPVDILRKLKADCSDVAWSLWHRCS